MIMYAWAKIGTNSVDDCMQWQKYAQSKCLLVMSVEYLICMKVILRFYLFMILMPISIYFLKTTYRRQYSSQLIRSFITYF